MKLDVPVCFLFRKKFSIYKFVTKPKHQCTDRWVDGGSFVPLQEIRALVQFSDKRRWSKGIEYLSCQVFACFPTCILFSCQRATLSVSGLLSVAFADVSCKRSIGLNFKFQDPNSKETKNLKLKTKNSLISRRLRPFFPASPCNRRARWTTCLKMVRSVFRCFCDRAAARRGLLYIRLC